MRYWKSPLAAMVLAAAIPQTATADTIKIAMNGVADIATSSEYAFVVAFGDALKGSGMEIEVFSIGCFGVREGKARADRSRSDPNKPCRRHDARVDQSDDTWPNPSVYVRKRGRI